MKNMRKRHLHKIVPLQRPTLLLPVCVHQLVHVPGRSFPQFGKPRKPLTDSWVIFLFFLGLIL